MELPALNYTYTLPSELQERPQEIPNFEASVAAVESLLKYTFCDRRLLEAALTHPSYADSWSYQRLEFAGDAVLQLAITNFIFLQYPHADPGKLSLLRSANISTEKLARVSVRHKLYMYVRHNTIALDERVRDFVLAVQEEDEAELYGGLVKAPKVLADIVEAIAAAIYVDCNFDLKTFWLIFREFLEPIIMLDMLEQQPVTLLFETCQKDGKHVDIRKNQENIESVYVDGEFVASASSDQKGNARLQAARAALQKLSYEKVEIDIFSQLNGDEAGSKQKLHDLCGKRKWPKPAYKIERESGRAHERKYICSVEIEIAEGILFETGNEKSKVKEAENSAAYLMLHGLKDKNYLYFPLL